MTNSALFRPTTTTGRLLWYLWDMIDISENMHRVEGYIVKVRNGIPALLHAAVFLMLFIVSLALAWYFDIQSTLTGLSSITDLVIPELPKQTARFGYWVVLAFTLAPTFLEIFTAGAAKEDVKIFQIAIIAFTLFDLVTDIPRSFALSMSMWPQIELMGWGLSSLVFWLYFLFVLFFATIGFELMTVLFGYMVVCFVLRAFKGEGSIKLSQYTQHMPQMRSTAPTTSVDDDKVVIIK